MLNSLKGRFVKLNVFDEIFEDTATNGENQDISQDEDEIEQSSLFKIPKYMETVNKFINYI